jgi:hypothetical protein
MSLIIPANSASAAGGYVVDNSCRFNPSSSDYLSKTFGSAGDRDTWTFSCWVKKSKNGSEQRLLTTSDNSTFDDFIRFNSGDTFTVECNNATVLTTNRLFRDNSAFYHIIVVWNSGNATSGDRCRLYVNGTRETSFSTETYPSQNQDSFINNNTAHYIGVTNVTANSHHFNGYMSEINFIDGQALAPSDFGEFDEDSGIWKPIAYEGTYGTNGFYLDFEDSAALGDDVSGNGNDFTVNNLTAIDQTTDTPTNNFITMNPLDSYYSASTFSEGNLKIVSSSGNYSPDMGTIGLSAGKWYWEVKIDNTSTEDMVGITGNQRLSSGDSTSHLGGMLYDFAYNSYARFYNNNSFVSYGATFGTNDIIGVALDLDSGTNTIQFYKNGAAQGSKNITHVSSTENGFYHVSAGDFTSGASMTFSSNFGNPPYTISSGNTDGNGYGNFEYSVPSGYYALNTKNLAEYG